MMCGITMCKQNKCELPGSGNYLVLASLCMACWVQCWCLTPSAYLIEMLIHWFARNIQTRDDAESVVGSSVMVRRRENRLVEQPTRARRSIAGNAEGSGEGAGGGHFVSMNALASMPFDQFQHQASISSATWAGNHSVLKVTQVLIWNLPIGALWNPVVPSVLGLPGACAWPCCVAEFLMKFSIPGSGNHTQNKYPGARIGL